MVLINLLTNISTIPAMLAVAAWAEVCLHQTLRMQVAGCRASGLLQQAKNLLMYPARYEEFCTLMFVSAYNAYSVYIPTMKPNVTILLKLGCALLYYTLHYTLLFFTLLFSHTIWLNFSWLPKFSTQWSIMKIDI